MDQIKISAKNLGQIALDTFCSRCFWIKLKVNNKLPWQIFPGIFSSIDAYTKKAVHSMIDSPIPIPAWMLEMGDIKGYQKVPHWSKFNVEIPEHNILLTGVPDDFLLDQEQNYIIPDYKTSKFTETQDKLRPMYDIQLNCYDVIARGRDIQPVVGLYLVYMEPVTDEAAAGESRTKVGFSMGFKAYAVPVEQNRQIVDEALETTREIYELSEAPEPIAGCKECQNLDVIHEFLLGIR